MQFILVAALLTVAAIFAATSFERLDSSSQLIEGVDLLSWKFPKAEEWNDYVQCYVDLLDEISKTNGLWEMWYLYGKQIQIHINDWKKCGDKYCNYIKQRSVFLLVDEYLILMYSVRPKLLPNFMEKVEQKCGHVEQ